MLVAATLTAMIGPEPSEAARRTGRFSITAPSTYARPPISLGGKMPGRAHEAVTASATRASRRPGRPHITCMPLWRSVVLTSRRRLRSRKVMSPTRLETSVSRGSRRYSAGASSRRRATSTRATWNTSRRFTRSARASIRAGVAPAAHAAPISDPMLDPTTRLGASPRSSSARNTPMWASPLRPPPLSTRVKGRSGITRLPGLRWPA